MFVRIAVILVLPARLAGAAEHATIEFGDRDERVHVGTSVPLLPFARSEVVLHGLCFWTSPCRAW